MSSTSYTMWYWRSTKGPLTVDPDHVVTQGAKLIDAAKSELKDNKILFLPSTAGKTGGQQPSIEIAIFFPTVYPEKGQFDRAKGSEILSTTARNLRLDYGDFVVQDKEDVQSFSGEELQRIFDAANSFSDWVVTTARAASAGVPAGTAASSLHIAPWRVERLRNARGEGIEKEIKSTLNAAKSWKDGKSTWSTLLMMASGIAIVSTALAVYGAIQNVSVLVALAYVGVTMELVTVGATVGAVMSAIAPWAILAGIAIGLGVLALKGASNVLLVINNTSSQIVRRRNEIANGKTQTETPVIESEPKPVNRAKNFASVGIYVYSKDETFGMPLSLFGSLIGVSFSLSELDDRPSFSVGMDCPNSIMGGRNSINLLPNDDPSGVAGLAVQGHNEDGECKIAQGKVHITARRAAPTGVINYGLCFVTEEL